MKPAPFALHRPQTLGEALDLLAGQVDAKVLAGGQSLVPLLNFRLARPAHLVDLGLIDELGVLRRTPDRLRVGAMVRQAYAERSAAVGADCPLLAAALPNVAHPPIRSRGTIGGSLAHADAAAELPTVACALDAELVAATLRGRRTIPAAEFFIGHLTTALKPDEILVEVALPRRAPGTGAAFAEVSRRRGDFALAAVAVQVRLAGGVVEDARVCFAAVAAHPRRCAEAERELTGTRAGAREISAAADAARSVLDPPADLHATGAYRRDAAAALLRTALGDALARARADADTDAKEKAAR